MRLRSSTAVMSDFTIVTNRLSTVSPLDSRSRIVASKPSYTSRESSIHLAREQFPQRAAVALRIGKHDHPISRLSPAHEMVSIERLVFARNGIEAAGHG